MRGRSLMFMGQGISNLGSTIGDMMLKSKESKKEQKRYDEGAPKRQLELDLLGQEKLLGEKKNKAQDIALAQAEEKERLRKSITSLFNEVKTNPAAKKVFTEELTKIGQAEPQTRYQTPAGTWEGEETAQPQTTEQTIEQAPKSPTELKAGVRQKIPGNVYGQMLFSGDEGMTQQAKYLMEPEEAPGETAEQKMAREKELISFRADEAKRTRPPGKTGGEQERKSTTASAKDVSDLGFGLGHLETLRKLVSSKDATIFNTAMPFGTGGFTNPELQNALDNLTELHGRKQSGAAIAKSEWSNFKKQILNSRFLATEEGRQEALKQIDNFIGRYYTQGELNTKNQNWYEEYKQSKARGVTKISGEEQKQPGGSGSSFNELWGE